MKTAKDPRHLKREQIMRELFEWDFNPDSQLDLAESKAVVDQVKSVDELILECAPSWPIDKINKIDLAILRLALYELKNDQTPEKVVVDEAIELAKAYGSDASPAFINGVLGKYIQTLAKTP